MNLHENISLKPYNTFGIDATAQYFSEITSENELLDLLINDKVKHLNRFILGGGSNILLTKNFDGLVIKNSIKGIKLINEDDQYYYVRAGAGVAWHDLVMYCIDHNYAGIENMSLIPGCAGASPIQNIGAYGVEIKDVLFELEALRIHDCVFQKFNLSECKFGYRESVFKNELKGKYIITSITLRLNRIPKLNTSYGAIEKELEIMGVKELSIKAVSQAVINIRSSKLPDPFKIGNAGSFFKNPEITAQQFEDLKKQFPEIVAFPQKNGNVKLAAGWLIEQCGWKGKTVGNAGVHKNQALVLVNYGNATGKEIWDLSQQILDSVKNKFSVDLEREVNVV